MKVFIKAFMVATSLLFAGIGNPVYAGPALLQDAYTVTGAYASQNYGSSPSLIVAANATSYLQFSVNSYVPTGTLGKDVAKATLKIFVNSVTTAGSFNVSSVNSAWIEETIRGNYQPITQGIQGVNGNTGATGPVSTVPGPTGPQGSFPNGTKAGDMQYWNGTAWVMIKAGARNAVFRFCDGAPTWVVTDCSKFVIGDTGPAGGKVFYITEGGLHGLEAAPVDQTSDVFWGCQGTSIAGTSAALGTGAANTALIVAGCNEANTAAKVAAAYSLNGYDDWYLPSKDELDLLYDQKTVVGGFPPSSASFSSSSYWSSTEYGSTTAWYQNLTINGQQNTWNKATTTFQVRAIRSF